MSKRMSSVASRRMKMSCRFTSIYNTLGLRSTGTAGATRNQFCPVLAQAFGPFLLAGGLAKSADFRVLPKTSSHIFEDSLRTLETDAHAPSMRPAGFLRLSLLIVSLSYHHTELMHRNHGKPRKAIINDSQYIAQFVEKASVSEFSTLDLITY